VSPLLEPKDNEREMPRGPGIPGSVSSDCQLVARIERPNHRATTHRSNPPPDPATLRTCCAAIVPIHAPVAQWSTGPSGGPKSVGLSSRRSPVRIWSGAFLAVPGVARLLLQQSRQPSTKSVPADRSAQWGLVRQLRRFNRIGDANWMGRPRNPGPRVAPSTFVQGGFFIRADNYRIVRIDKGSLQACFRGSPDAHAELPPVEPPRPYYIVHLEGGGVEDLVHEPLGRDELGVSGSWRNLRRAHNS
jgi:hypothetical protein